MAVDATEGREDAPLGDKGEKQGKGGKGDQEKLAMVRPAAPAAGERPGSIGDALSDFLQRNRRGLLVGCAVVVLALIGVAVVLAVRENLTARALSQVEALSARYEAVRFYIGGEDEEAAAHQEEIALLTDELAAFAARQRSGYAAARAYALLAGVYGDEKDWAPARDAWTSAAAAAGGSYLSPVALFNAGAAAEEAGDTAGAIALYTQALDYGDEFPSAPRAQFAVGRLEEGRGDTEAARDAYEALVSRWPDEEVWTNLAQSRLLVLGE